MMIKTVGVLLFVASFALLAPLAALAETVTVSWAHPTTYVDGTPLALADIVATEVECVSALTSCPAAVSVVAPAAAVVVDIGPVPGRGGDVCFRARTRVLWDVSDFSATACKTFQPKKPRAPSGVSVQ